MPPLVAPSPPSLLSLCHRVCRRALIRLLKVRKISGGYDVIFMDIRGMKDKVFLESGKISFVALLGLLLGKTAPLPQSEGMLLPDYLIPLYRGAEDNKFIDYCLPVVKDYIEHKCLSCDLHVDTYWKSYFPQRYYAGRIEPQSVLIQHVEREHAVEIRHGHHDLPLATCGDLIHHSDAFGTTRCHSPFGKSTYRSAGYKGVFVHLHIVGTCKDPDCYINRCTMSAKCFPVKVVFPVPTLSTYVVFDSLRALHGLPPKWKYGDAFVSEENIYRRLQDKFTSLIWEKNFSLFGPSEMMVVPGRNARRRARKRSIRFSQKA